MSPPMISVLLPVYNGEKFIAQAVQSILDQTYRYFELIIIDDGSTDRTAAILDQFQDERIKRLKNEKNIGLVGSLNRASSIAQGEYFARMDADDLSNPERLAKQVDFLEEHSEVGVLGTGAAQVDSRGRFISTLVMPQMHELILWHFFFDLPIIHATVMMRKEILHLAGGYRAEFAHSEDMDLWSRMIFQTRFVNLSTILYTRRLHRASIGSTESRTQVYLTTAIRQKVFRDIIGCDVPYAIARWFADPFHVLAPEDKKGLIHIFFKLYKYMVRTFELSPVLLAHIEDDLLRRINIAEHNNQRAVRKLIFRMFRDLMPLTMRHKLKNSKVGYFLGPRI